MYAEFVKNFRAEFHKELNKKTGWGRLEVMHLVDVVLANVGATQMDKQLELDLVNKPKPSALVEGT